MCEDVVMAKAYMYRRYVLYMLWYRVNIRSFPTSGTTINIDLDSNATAR